MFDSEEVEASMDKPTLFFSQLMRSVMDFTVGVLMIAPHFLLRGIHDPAPSSSVLIFYLCVGILSFVPACVCLISAFCVFLSSSAFNENLAGNKFSKKRGVTVGRAIGPIMLLVEGSMLVAAGFYLKAHTQLGHRIGDANISEVELVAFVYISFGLVMLLCGVAAVAICCDCGTTETQKEPWTIRFAHIALLFQCIGIIVAAVLLVVLGSKFVATPPVKDALGRLLIGWGSLILILFIIIVINLLRGQRGRKKSRASWC